MLHLLATAFLFAPAIDDPISAEPTANDELAALAAELAAAENYTFTSLSASDGGGFGGFGGGFGGGRGRGGEGDGRGEGGEGGEDGEAPERPAPTPVTGHYVAGDPLHLAQGEAEGYREGETFVYRTEAEGEWQVMETGGGGRGGFGGFGGGGGGRGERGSAGGREGFRAAMGLMRATAPASSFADFGDKIDAEALQVSVVEATDEASGKTTFSGPLTSDGASAFSGSRFGFGRGGRGGRGGGGDEGPQMETSGTFTIEVVDGAITSAVFTVTTSGSFGDREFERTSTNTYTFSNIGETEHATPDDVIVHFEI